MLAWEPVPDWQFETSLFTVPCCYCCRIYPYQYFIVLGSRFFYLFELKNIGRPIFFIYNRFYQYPPNLLLFGHLIFAYICFADPEAIAVGLNPLTINHTAKAISCKPNGTSKRI